MWGPLIEQPGFKSRTPMTLISDSLGPMGRPLMSKSELLHHPELREHVALD